MDYYEYKQGEKDWWIKRPPLRNKSFDKELERLGGTNTFGNPVLKAEWMGTLMSDTAYEPTLAFKTVWEGVTHYDHSGFISVPVNQKLELGVLRWGIFKWMSTEEAMRGGRFNQEAMDERGKPLYRKPPREGIYNLWFKVETADGRYKPLDDEVLYAVREMWHYNENTPIDKKIEHLKEDERRQAREDSDSARAAWY
jgi:hypothetical protein